MSFVINVHAFYKDWNYLKKKNIMVMLILSLIDYNDKIWKF